MHINSKFVVRMTSMAFCCCAALLFFQLSAGCDQGGKSAGEGTKHESSAAEEPSNDAGSAAVAPAVTEGQVVETMNAGRYTYVRVQAGDETVWAAGPVTDLKVGDKVVISTEYPMKNFHSETLDRTFETLYFVSSFDGRGEGGPDPHDMASRMHGGGDAMSDQQDAGRDGSGIPAGSGAPAVPRQDVGNIVKAPGGLTVGEIYTRTSELAGQKVIVRGVVVKFAPAIMGTNWLHLQDGTGLEGFHDLTVTTHATVRVGDLITIQGVLAANKDFGAGYRYDVIVERGELITD